MNTQATLHFFCGKMAAGKSTLAKELATKNHALLLSEDILLSQLYTNEIKNISDYIKYSTRLREALAKHIQSVLEQGLSVVLDFSANTKQQRNWFRSIYENSHALHILHYIELNDDICKRQLKKRNQGKEAGAAFTSEEEFDEITKYFQPPSDDENFRIVKYNRAN